MVEVDEVVVVVEIVESETEETNVEDRRGSGVDSVVRETEVGDGGGSQTAWTGAGCWVLWTRRVRGRVRASGVCVRFLWISVSVQVPVPWVVSCVVHGGFVAWSWTGGLVRD